MAEAPMTIWVEKFFTWELVNFDPSTLKKCVTFSNGNDGIFEGPIMRAFDRYNNVERAAKFEIELYTHSNYVTFEANITPNVINKKCYYFLKNGEGVQKKNAFGRLHINGKFSKVLFCVDVELPLPSIQPVMTTLEKIKKVWEEDPANKFIIKCQDSTFETLKPILAACSPVFKAMFDSNMKEAVQNQMEITDFEPKVIQKMIEFCETNEVAAFEELELELLKIGHKYQNQELMDYVMREMAITTTKENRGPRSYVIGNFYSFEDYMKWWSSCF